MKRTVLLCELLSVNIILHFVFPGSHPGGPQQVGEHRRRDMGKGVYFTFFKKILWLTSLPTKFQIIVLERNRRVAKAYARAPVLTVNGSDDGFDGFRQEKHFPNNFIKLFV